MGLAHLMYDRDSIQVIREPWLGASTLSFAPRPRDVLDVLDIAVARNPDSEAVLDAVTGRSRTTRQLADDVAATAAAWRREGLQPGDGVGIAADNSGDHLVAILACAATGAVAVGLSSRLAVAQWRYQLEHARCQVLLHDDAHAEQAEAAAKEMAGLRLSPELVPSDRDRDQTWANFAPDRVPVEPQTAYQVVYTSGTTGHPKASQVVHRASLHSGIAYDRLLRLNSGDSTGVLFNLGYISAMHAHVLPALLSGARLVMLPSGSPRTWVTQLAEFDIAWAYAVPSWWLLALREPSLRADLLPRLRLAAAGGSPFPDVLRDGLAQRLPDTELLNIYGLSETHSPATVLRGRELWEYPGSAGRALEVVEVQIRDTEARPVADGEAGEVWLRSSLVTTGYANDATATGEALVDGMLRTGDVGVLMPSAVGGSVLRLMDRVKDMVNRAGNKVYSAEVERVLGEHPAIGDSACVAAPDPRSGETVAVFLILTEGAERPRDGAIRAWVREYLGSSAAPSIIRWVDDLPRGGTGKTNKRELRSRLAGPASP